MSHQALEASGLIAGYGNATVLSDVHLHIPGGCRTALLGANGSGKTTLLKVLSGAHRPQAGQVRVGEHKLRHSRAGLTEHRQRVQLVMQDPDDQLFSADVRRDVSFGPTNLGLSRGEVIARVDEALDVLGLGALADRPIHALSYGQRKRVAIAGALAMRPCLLLLDEPTAGLDPAGVEEMLLALTSLEAHGTTVVLSTHDVDLALAWADRVAIVEHGIVHCGPPGVMLGDAALLQRSRLHPPRNIQLALKFGIPRDHVERTPPRTLDDVVALVGALARFPAAATH